MTALNFCIQRNEIYVAMDTLATSPVGTEPYLYTTKFYILPHLKMVICGTGFAQVIIDWFIQVNTSILVQDICHLDEYAVEMLQKLGSKHLLDKSKTATIYHFGWSQLEECSTGFIYRSENKFLSERLQNGIGIKPHFNRNNWIDNANEEIDFIKIIQKQKLLDRQQVKHQQVGIGGEIHLLHITQKAILVKQLHRFDDYDNEYLKMTENLCK